MRILVLGDIVSKVGRDVVAKNLNNVINEYGVEFIVANVDNAANGTGITEAIAKDLFRQGICVLTGGNHIVDKQEIFEYLNNNDKLLRPMNFNKKTHGYGYTISKVNDKKVLVIHIMGQVFMPQLLDNPFHIIDDFLSNYQLGKNVDAIIVDFHADATSEKYAMGHFLDGRVSCVFGTHTHVPTNDAHILSNGTAYITDLGMNGDYDSIIGTDKKVTLENFLRQFRYRRMEQTNGEGTFCGAFIETDDSTGLATMIESIKIGGTLAKCKK